MSIILQSLPAGYPRVRRCGDVAFRALVKGSRLGSFVSLWAKPHPWRRATARRFFLSARDQRFESVSLQRGVRCEPDFRGRIPSMASGISPGAAHSAFRLNNYLGIDPRFGTKQELIDLVQAAHGFSKNGRPFPIRIILDVVINHSGDNWSNPGGFRFLRPLVRTSASTMPEPVV